MSQKLCNGCQKTQNIGLFGRYAIAGEYRSRAQCKACEKKRAQRWRKDNPEKAAQLRSAYYERHPRKRREEQYRLKAKRWGYDPDAVLDYIAQHGDACDCCGQVKKLHLDHCHATTDIRGMLCSDCNTGVGLFCDDIGLLKNAINYLQNQKPLKR